MYVTSERPLPGLLFLDRYLLSSDCYILNVVIANDDMRVSRRSSCATHVGNLPTNTLHSASFTSTIKPTHHSSTSGSYLLLTNDRNQNQTITFIEANTVSNVLLIQPNQLHREGNCFSLFWRWAFLFVFSSSDRLLSLDLIYISLSVNIHTLPACQAGSHKNFTRRWTRRQAAGRSEAGEMARRSQRFLLVPLPSMPRSSMAQRLQSPHRRLLLLLVTITSILKNRPAIKAVPA